MDHGFSPQTSGEQYKIQQEPRVLRRDGDGAQPEKTESYSDVKAALTDCGCAAGGVGGQRTGTTRVCGMRQLHYMRTRIGGVQGGWGNRLKGPVPGERLPAPPAHQPPVLPFCSRFEGSSEEGKVDFKKPLR